MRLLIILFFGFSCFVSKAQNQDTNFWKNVQFGGGAALNFSNQFTQVSVQPMAVYPLNKYYSPGVSLQYSYMRLKNEFETQFVGGSLINFLHPVPEIQLSVELEQLYINRKNYVENTVSKSNFWNTALFVGGGYRTNNVIVGIRYNVLFNQDKNVYPRAWMPFVRIFF
ncbi:MAG: hypothetical protein ACQESK_11070 [Bacteroidota bacterium]